VWVAAGAIALVFVALVVSRALVASQGGSGSPDAPAPAALVAEVTGVPDSTLEQVGRGNVSQLPTAVRRSVELGPNGHPLVSYIGAEYCPYCAGERWPLVVALSRFGTFSGLSLSHSATDDIYPNTPTFSFVGSSYTSDFVDFSAVELETNVRSGSGYQTLQTPTPAQVRILQTYDAPPFVPATSQGAIPFVDFANQYVLSGATFDVGVLAGLSQDQVAAALADPGSTPARSILGSANVLIAAICSGTGNTPEPACGRTAVSTFESELAASPARGG
jgi:hypothetical protein